MTALFAYGTFARRRWRDALLGAPAPAQPAILRGWARVVLRGGYLSLRRDPAARVAGVVVTMDARAWERADAWEEVPRYRRVPVVVTWLGQAYAAETYVRDAPHDAPLADEARFAALPDDEVEAQIRAFLSA